MATSARQTGQRRDGSGESGRRRTLSAVLAVTGSFFVAGPAAAVGTHVGSLDVVSRADSGVLPVYPKDGRYWVVGTPGHEYSLRVCNTTGGRVLAVMSVDGINVITGHTASPAQSGYVLEARECADIEGWRKSLERTAAFYFTELPDSYAARTGRPANVGVVGVAFFREKAQPIAYGQSSGKIAANQDDAPAARRERASEAAASGARASADAAAPQSDAARAAAVPVAPAPATQLGTGHGRSETSYAQMTHFERESARPTSTIAIHYDRRENLVAMGVLPPPVIARTPNPFPRWEPRFTPDPPTR